MNPSYTALEPDSLKILNVTSPTFKDGDTTFVTTITFVYTLFVVAIVMAAFYRYVVAGTLRMQASENAIRQSNEMIKKATLGLLGVFSLFLILFTINKGLVTGDIGLGSLRKGSTTTPSGTSQGTVKTGEPITTTKPGATQVGSGQDAINDDARVRSILSGIGISINKPVCGSPSQKNCTTVGSLPENTLSMLRSLRSTCGGTIEITGGTESGHASHGPGKNPVDIHIGGVVLDTCIRGFTKGTSRNFCKSTYTNFGYTFCDELNTDPHWHVFK
jgi:hypothetical protein